MQGTCKLQYLMLVPDILAMTLVTPVDNSGTHVNKTLYTFLDHRHGWTETR
jgi:hypothetical protein